VAQAIYTIGHGTRSIEEFVTLLHQAGIKYLADVRSRPYSRFNPQYNRKALQASLEKEGITYVFMGDSLGGRPGDPSCYNHEGKVDYDKLRQKEIFKKGIERLKAAFEKGLMIALMCSESKPAECHRGKLIGKVLLNEKIPVMHITGIKNRIAAGSGLTDVLTFIPQEELFNNKGDITLFS
jgi:uncharacterized protein (DUF488 family)